MTSTAAVSAFVATCRTVSMSQAHPAIHEPSNLGIHFNLAVDAAGFGLIQETRQQTRLNVKRQDDVIVGVSLNESGCQDPTCV